VPSSAILPLSRNTPPQPTVQAAAVEPPPGNAATVVSLLIPDVEAAALAGISRSHLHRLRAGGLFGPRPIKLGRALRFNRQEVIDWIGAKCPDAKTFAAMQAAAGRRIARVVG